MVLDLNNKSPFDIENAVEIPGWGQVPPNIIDDAVSRARYAWQTRGAAYAISAWGTKLQNMIDKKTWRSQDAYDRDSTSEIFCQNFHPGKVMVVA